MSLNLRKKKKQQGAGGKKKREKAAAAAAAAASKAAEIEAREKEKAEEERAERGADGESDEESGGSEPDEANADQNQAQRRESEQVEISKELAAKQKAENKASLAAKAGVERNGIVYDEDDPELSKPIARFNTMLAIQRNTLYLYGGIHETAEREYTLDDFYILQLDKLEQWICLRECKIEGLEWNESDESDDDSSDDDDDDSSSSSSSSDSDGEQEGVEVASLHEHSDEEEDLVGDDGQPLDPAEVERRRQEREGIKKQAKEAWGVAKGSKTGDGAAAESVTSEEQRNTTPNPGETLRMFFDRTRNYWSAKAFELSSGEARGKESRTKGFELAEARYEEYKPVLREIEKIQAEAGLDAEEMRQSAQRTAHGPLGGGVGVDSRHRR